MKRLKIVLLFSVLIVVSIITVFRLYNPPKSIYNNETEVVGKVINIKAGSCTQLEVLAKEKVLVFDCTNKKYKYGIKVKVKGKLEEPSESSIFSYKKFLLSKNIYKIIYADSVEIIDRKENLLYKFKNMLNEKIKNYKSKQYLNAFVLGKTDLIDEDVLTSYQNNGISHLFAISGMHITFLSTILFFILKKILSPKKTIFFISLFLLFYVFVTNFSPSVIRAVFMFILINFTIKNKLFILIYLFFIMLLINPYYLFNVGFCFSYVVTFFLVYFKEMITKNKNYISKTFIISVIAFLASLPILINCFYSVNFLTPIWNLFFVPLITIFIYPLSILTYLINFLDGPFTSIMRLFELCSLSLSKIDFLTFSFKKMNILGVVLYFVVIFFSLKESRYIFMLIVIILFHININFFDNNYYLTAIDVGQGDSILLKFPNNGSSLLIDTGGNVNSSNNISKNKIIPYLKSEGISKLDYLILTHGDYDHMGESISLVENFRVEKVIFNCGEFNDLENELIKVLDEKKIPYYSCIKELNIDNNKLYFLNNKDYGNENDNSSVIYTELNGYKFMFMGDASGTTEKEILNKYNLSDIDVLKAGHHGSKTSSSKEFIDTINPKYSIISVGKNNRYGHPNKEVLDNLKDTKIYRTDKDGSIMFKIKNNKLKIETCSP